MEFWDVYDDNCNKTGRIIERDNKNDILGEGEHSMAVHVYLRNSRGDFLLQKRSMKKKNMPGVWDMTGGAVIAGEDSVAGAIREVHEELGILIEKEDLKLICRLKRPHCFIDIWDVVKDIDLSACILQKDEVDEVKYVGKEELFELFEQEPYYDREYNDILRKYYC